MRILGDYVDEASAARAQLMRWVAEGKIVRHQDVQIGFEQLPRAFVGLFSGANRGPLLVSVA
jgi:NADPH-dependent curcumin reductase CurA